MIRQLRINEIFERTKNAFHARFRDHAMRIMARHGLTVLRTWETTHDGRTEFAYALEWPDLATKERAWRDFFADEEWKESPASSSTSSTVCSAIAFSAGRGGSGRPDPRASVAGTPGQRMTVRNVKVTGRENGRKGT